MALTVSSGQVLSGTTFSGDFLIVQSGGSVVATTLAADFLETQRGGSAINTDVLGFDEVLGGSDTGATVQSGGFLQVGSGGTASGARIQSGGVLQVWSGGTAVSSVIARAALALVYSGGTAVAPSLQSGSTLTVSSGGQVSNAILVPGASIELGSLPFASGGSASIDPNNDVLTITEGGQTTTLQLQGNYSGDSFTIGSFYQFLPGVSSSQGTTITEVKGNIVVPTQYGGGVPVTTTTPIQTALVQQIVALAAQTPGSQTVSLPGQGQLNQATSLTSPVFIDLPERLDTITGASAVPVANLLLANPGVTYITGGTVASTVAATDGAPATIINNGASDALVAVTGAAGNTLEGLAGANAFITGSGGHDAVLLNGAANALLSYGSDVVLVGGASTITAAAGGGDTVSMTSGTTLAFIDQADSQSANAVTAAANGTVITAGSGNAVINAGAGPESFFVDTSAGNVTLNGAGGGGDSFTFVKGANAGSASVLVTNFVANDTVGVHGYAALNVQAPGNGGALLALSDGSQVTFSNVSVATVQQAIRIV